MSMKRGYCTNCNKNDESRRIFELNPDVKFCYCPHCGKKYRPKIAMMNYKRVIQKYNHRAAFFLKNAMEPELSYRLFAYVLELESYNKFAKLGRLLSLAYLSNVRRNRFIEVYDMLDIQKEEFHGNKSIEEYLIFLLALDKCTVDYISLIKKKLTLHGYYFDIDCAKLYLKHVRDAIVLKRLIASEFSKVEYEKYASRVNDSIKEFENEYHSTIITADGQDHYFANFAKSGEPLVTNGRKVIDTKLGKYRLSTLDEEDKKLRIIKNTLFNRKYAHMYHIYDKAFLFVIGLAFIGGAFLASYFAFMKYSNAIALLVLAVVLIAGALTFLTLRFLFRYILKKPRI